ncbi:MAG: hypothetical protein ACLGHM_00780 [Actinomycetes bacterium]|jgi:hypothetical protein
MTDNPAPDAAATEQRRVERERIVAYLAHHESGARAKAEAATTEESRTYQTTIANAMKAMGEAIGGEFHWKARL